MRRLIVLYVLALASVTQALRSVTRRKAFKVLNDVVATCAAATAVLNDVVATCAAATAATSASPANAVVQGRAASLDEAKAAGTVALWIDLAGCDVCRHDVPAACTGTLIADDLVLSAQHCIDIPDELGGKLTKVVFGADMFSRGAVSVPVSRYLRPSDVPGLELSKAPLANDMVLIKLARPAPKDWTRVAVGGAFPTDAYASILRVYGFGDRIESDEEYTSGTLRSIDLVNTSPRTGSQYLARSLRGKTDGTCNGDSGAAALLLDENKKPAIVGVLSSTSLPCAPASVRRGDVAATSQIVCARAAARRRGDAAATSRRRRGERRR